MHSEIIETQNKLQRLFAKAATLQSDDRTDVEFKAGFVSYLCIRTYAYVESSVQIILKEYVKSVTTDVPIERFVNDQLRINRALRRHELLNLIGKFSEEWRENLRDATRGRLGDSLDGIVINRNTIAHGGDSHNLSLAVLKSYFSDAKEVVRLVFEECNRSTTKAV